MITEQQAITLANLLAMIRPGDWRPQQLMDLFHDHCTTAHPFKDIAEVAIRAANNPEIKSPNIIFLDGKHWNLDRPTKKPNNPKCQEHPTYDAHSCSCCWADIKLGERPENMLGKQLTPKTGATTKPVDWGKAFENIGHKTAPNRTERPSATTRGVAPF